MFDKVPGGAMAPGTPIMPNLSPKAAADRPPGMLESVVHGQGNIYDRLGSISHRLDRLADRLLGPVPTNGVAQPTPEPTTLLNKIHEGNALINRRIDQLFETLERLEQL